MIHFNIASRLVLVGLALAVLPACSDKKPDLKSPCVGAEGSPCDRRPVNDWWLPKNS